MKEGVPRVETRNLKLIKSCKSKGKIKIGGKVSSRVNVDDDGLLIISLFRKKFFGFCDKSYAWKILDRQPKPLQLFKSQNGNSELLPQAFRRSRQRTRKQFIMGARATLSWLIEMDSVSLNDTVELRTAKNKVVKVGWVTMEGIFCNCCSGILSISEFKAHAGSKEQSSPLVLFLQSGKPYALCQLEAWSIELKVGKNSVQVVQDEEADQNDDFCALFGADGVLACCDNCPSSYHQSCLSAKIMRRASK